MRLRRRNHDAQVVPLIIAVDIDSTLHPYWEQFTAIVYGRFGVELPYEHQRSWGIPALREEQLRWCVQESHRDEHVLAAIPYPGAVEALNRWASMGHSIHVASHRSSDAVEATDAWLGAIGLNYAGLHCVDDKMPVCTEIGVGLLIDDSPENLERGIAQGVAVATIEHPWNRDFCETEEVISAPDWPALAQALGPRLVSL